MGIFGRKKEEKKKFDYSDETKEVFAERDAFYSEMRQKMGGNASNPELADQPKTEETKPQTDNLDDKSANILRIYNKHREQNLHKMKKIPVFKKDA